MRLSETNRIVLPILLIAFFVFLTFGWVYRFQNHEMGRIIEAERLLNKISDGIHEVNRAIQSGIMTLDEKYAVQAARHSLRVLEMLTALEKLQPQDAAAIRRRYLEHYVKIVSTNSLFLEKRIDTVRLRLAELETGYSHMKTEIGRMADVRTSQYRRAVSSINGFMAVTSIVFSVLLILIAGLFIRNCRKSKAA